jgi:hypothetical protein
MSSTTRSDTPRPRQVSYLKSLAEQTGTSFTYPKTLKEASREIDRLLTLKESGQVEMAIRLSDGEVEPLETELVYATGVQPGEIVGFGSAARWRKDAP